MKEINNSKLNFHPLHLHISSNNDRTKGHHSNQGRSHLGIEPPSATPCVYFYNFEPLIENPGSATDYNIFHFLLVSDFTKNQTTKTNFSVSIPN